MAHSKNVLKPDDAPIWIDGKLIVSPEPKYADLQDNNGDTELERIRAMIRHEFSNVAQKHELETFEEANDFDVDDGWEHDPPDTIYMKEEYFAPQPGHGDQLPPKDALASDKGAVPQNGNELSSPQDETGKRTSQEETDPEK